MESHVRLLGDGVPCMLESQASSPGVCQAAR